jgi:hypothetical protein
MTSQPGLTDDQKAKARPWLISLGVSMAVRFVAAAAILAYLMMADHPNVPVAGGTLIATALGGTIWSRYAQRRLDQIVPNS